MGASKLEIYNLALGHVKQKPLTSLIQVNIQRSECDRYWDSALRETIRGHDWAFATTVEALVKPEDAAAWATGTAYGAGDFVANGSNIYYCLLSHTSTTGAFAIDLAAGDWVQYTIYDPTGTGWAFAYALPYDAVAVWHVYNSYTVDKVRGDEYRILYDKANDMKILLTNTDEAYAEYNSYVTNTDLFDGNFVTCLAYRLAADICPNLTGDDQLTAGMIKLFNNAMSEAERMASYEGENAAQPTSKMIDART